MVSNPFTDPDWAERVTQFIADWTEKIRVRTTQPLIYLARAIVFGVIATIGVIASVTLLLIGIMRLVINVLDNWFAHSTAVWSAYFIVGGLFLLVGMFLMTKRYTKNTDA